MKKFALLLLFLAEGSFAQVPVISRSVSSLQATQTGTVTCTANCTGLTWKVNGIAGGNSTIGTISGNDTSATYTAPASIVANNSWGGCPTGFNDVLWNTPVAGMPLVSNWRGDPFLNSAWYITYGLYRMQTSPVGMADTFGIGFSNSSSPLLTIAGVKNIPWSQTPSRLRETGVYNWAFTDQHVELINTDTCDLWEEYQDHNQTTSCSGSQTCYIASSAAHMPVNTYTRVGGNDAGGNMIAPYLLHLSEVKAGVVKHALHLNMPQSADSNQGNLMWPATWGTGFCGGKDVVGLSGFPTGSGYTAATTITFSGGGGAGAVWTPIISGGVITGATFKTPATTAYSSTPTVVITDSGGGTGASLTAHIDLPCLPYGSRVALDQTYLSTHAGSGCSAGSNCITGAGLVVATALANYGGVILDNEGNPPFWLFDTASDLNEDPATLNSIYAGLSHLTWDHFHVYDATNLGNNTANGGTTNLSSACDDNTGGEPCVSQQVVPGNNLNYIPPGADWITATNASGTSLPVTISLQPSTIGTTDTVLWVLAGDYSGSKGTSGGYQIPYWVHGNPNLAVTWTLQASPNGSITPGGIYTPPASTSTTGLQDIATCTLNADPNVTAQVYIHILPNAGNYVANTIRVDTANSSNFTDGNGNYWLGNVGLVAGGAGTYNNVWKYYAGSSAEKSVYNTGMYAYTDMVYTFIVPNGNYRVRLMSGWDQETWGPPSISAPTWNRMPYTIFSNDNGYTGKSGGSGGIKGLFWNMMEHASSPYAQDADSDFIFGSKVVDNRLVVGFGGGNSDQGTSKEGFPTCIAAYTDQGGFCSTLAELSGVDVEPDASAPHWVIGVTNGVPQSNVTSVVSDKPVVAPGRKLALYVQDWYTGLTNPTTGVPDPVWSIVSGPGTLTPTTLALTPGQQFPVELYTAPSSSIAGDTPVVVQVQSQSNPAITAQVTLTVRSSNNSPIQFK